MQHRRLRAVVVAFLALSVAGLPACGSGQAEVVQAEEPALAAPVDAEPRAPEDAAAAKAGEKAQENGQPSGQEQARGEAREAAPRPIETVRLAGRKTVEARTAKFTAFIGFSGISPEGANGPDGFSVRVDGAADFDKNVSKFTMYMPYAGQMRVRQIGQDVYLKMPEYVRSRMPYEEEWLRWTTEDAPQGRTGGSSEARSGTPDDAASGPEYLREVSNGVEEVGRDWVRGVATTHYRAEISLDRVAERGSRQMQETFREARDDLGLDELPVEAWIDDEGRIRRFNMEISLDTPELREAGVGEGAKMTLTEEIYDYGAPVRVVAPKEENTIDAEEAAGRGRENAA